MRPEGFLHDGFKWKVCYHPWQHSDDIIVEDKDIKDYDRFLLVKSGSDRVRIPGYTTKEKLMSTMKRDIYRNGKYYYMVHDTNLTQLTDLKIPKGKKVLKTNFIINQQTAENLGHTEMISGILAGLHSFAKKSKIYFKDINQKDECIIGDKKVKIYTRDALSDEDMLIYESYYKSHPEIDIYVLCKIKGGNYNYIGYIEKEVVDKTRIIQMIGEDSTEASGQIRRIFAEQYKNLSDYIKIEETEKAEEENIIPQNYVPLHVHSEYSIGDAFGSTKYIAEIAKKQGFKACALTDHGTMAGLLEFQRNALEQNIKPILGCEFYLIKENSEDAKRFHITALVKNKIGWENFLKIHAEASRKNFYYKPRVLLQTLFDNHEGIIILSGCSSGIFHHLIKNEKEKEAEELFIKFKNIFGEDFYAEMQAHDIPETKNQMVQQKMFSFANKHNVKCVFTTDSHYPLSTDKEYQEAIKSIGAKKDYGQAGFQDNCFYLMQDEDIKSKIEKDAIWMIPYIQEFKKNTFEICDKIDFKIEPPKETDTLPKLQFEGMTREDKLKQLSIDGLAKKTKYKYEGKIKERMDLELQRFLDKGYENYFLIVADLIKWAKDNGIRCGPCRGSAGASLAAFAMDITEVDPIEHDLLFDRFISEIRRDAPDIDMDFMDSRRDEIYHYLINKYGINNCARIVTYSKFHPKGVLKDIGRIFNIPDAEIAKVAGMVIERSGGDARASFSLSDTFSEFAEAKAFAQKYPQATKIANRLEGHIRHKGIHAAAMVVTERDVSSYVPVTKVSGWTVTEFEKGLCEDMNLIKFDILGLSELTIIDDALKSSGATLPREFDDEKVFKCINKGMTVGLFQMKTVGMTKFAMSMGIDSFNDMYDCNTLFRPGALHCITGDARVRIDGSKKTLRQLYKMQKQNIKLPLIYNGKGELAEAEKIHKLGKQECFEISLGKNKKIIATAEHKFMTKNGWKKLKDLTIDDELIVEKQEVWNTGLPAYNKGKKMNYSQATRKMLGDRLRRIGINSRFKNGSIPHNKGKVGWGRELHEKYPDKHPNYILNKNGRVSYKQKEMFNIIKEYFPDAVLNLRVKTNQSFRFLDVAIPSKMLNFEYDGEFWHKNKAEDDRRDAELKEIGWKSIHINKINFANLKEMIANEI